MDYFVELTNQIKARGVMPIHNHEWNFLYQIMATMNEFNLASLLNFAPLDPTVQKHVTNVYTQLSLCFVTSLVGCLLTLNRTISVGFEAASIGTIVMFFAVLFGSEKYRKLGLYGYTFLQGITLGYFTQQVGTEVVMHALLGTIAVFLCFSCAALTAPSRSYLYLGGILGSALSLMFWNNLFARLLGYSTMTLEIYGGLVLFCGYVVFDTQLMIAKAENGIKDVVGDCLNLWIDLVSIFIRLARILQDKEDKKKKK